MLINEVQTGLSKKLFYASSLTLNSIRFEWIYRSSVFPDPCCTGCFILNATTLPYPMGFHNCFFLSHYLNLSLLNP